MTTTVALDRDLARAQFPAFSAAELHGWVHVENAGGSFACRQVIDRLTRFYRAKVQPGHPSPLAQRLAREMEAGPAALAGWLGVPADAVVVGPSTTQHTYVLAQAVARVLPRGAAIVVSDQDHEANTGAWRRLAGRGVEIRVWEVDARTGSLDPEGLAVLLDDDVALVAFPHVSNLVGERNDVAAICAMAHDVGALAVVDGVAAAPHGLPDVPALGADVYLFSTYKTFGPHQGVMVLSRQLQERLPNQGHEFNADLPAKRLVPAGPDHAQVAALAGIDEYLTLLDTHHFGDDAPPQERPERVRGLLRGAETQALTPLLAFLVQRDDVRLLGTPDPARRAPTVSVVCDRPGAQVAADLATHRVMAAGGHFYAPRVLDGIGVDRDHGVLRVSLVHTTTPAEVEQVIASLDEVL